MFEKPVWRVSHFWLQIEATLHKINEFFIALNIAKGQIVAEHLFIPKFGYV
jgi:hypothetical protein